jgi:hypothetical protein
MISILAHNQVGRHWVYSGHYPRIFIAPKSARNAETKRWSGAVPILLPALLPSPTSAYTSLGVLQGLNPQPQLLNALVYHSATSAVWAASVKTSERSFRAWIVETLRCCGMEVSRAWARFLVAAKTKSSGVTNRFVRSLMLENAAPKIRVARVAVDQNFQHQ